MGIIVAVQRDPRGIAAFRNTPNLARLEDHPLIVLSENEAKPGPPASNNAPGWAASYFFQAHRVIN